MPAVAVALQRVQLGISGQIDGFRAALESDVPVDRDRIDLPFPAVLHIFPEPFGHDLVEQSAFGADSVPGPQILFASLVPQIFERFVQVAAWVSLARVRRPVGSASSSLSISLSARTDCERTPMSAAVMPGT